MYWHPIRLLPPGNNPDPLTLWSTEVDDDGRTALQRGREGKADGSPYEPKPGEDYFVNEALLCVFDGHGKTGHHASAFVKENFAGILQGCLGTQGVLQPTRRLCVALETGRARDLPIPGDPCRRAAPRTLFWRRPGVAATFDRGRDLRNHVAGALY